MTCDVAELLLGRFEFGDDESDVGFYDRSTRTFRTVSQHEFLDLAAGTADELEAAGVRSGDYVTIVATQPEALWRGFLGAILAGAVPLLAPVRPSLDSDPVVLRKLREIVDAVPTCRLFVQHGSDGPCVPWDGDSIRFDAEHSPGDALGRLRRLGGDPDRPLHLQLTSGSTGTVKPVVLTHANVVSSTASLAARMGVVPGDHVVSWLPLYHDMGLIGMAMLSLASGANLRLMSPFDFLSDPSHWLEAISTSPGTITAAPNFAFDYTTRRVSRERLAGLDLRAWKKCYCGAEPVDPITVGAFIERFAPAGLEPEVVHPTYGLAEATLMVTMPRTGEVPTQLTITRDSISTGGPVTVVDASRVHAAQPDPDAAFPTVSCLGVPADGMTIEILDGDGQAVLVEDYCGEVAVSGPAISPGYLQPGGSIDRFLGRCRTGDVGFMHKGELYLVERLKNIIILNGQNHSAGALERVIAARTSLPLDGCAVFQRSIVGSEAGVIAVLELPRGRDADALLESAQAAVRAEDLPVNEILVLRRGAIARTTSGKKQHSQVRSDLAAGNLKVLARSATITAETTPDPAPDDEIIDLDRFNDAAIVLGIIERHARRREWSGASVEEHHLLVGDLGLDSLTLIELSVDIEQVLGRGIAEHHLAELSTAGDVVRVVVDEVHPSMQLTDLLQRLVNDVPQVYRRVTEQRARQLLIDERWITDFASLNYLGLDLCPEVIESVVPAITKWGTHPSWTRAVASPEPYYELESGLAELCGAPDVMVFSTITLLHFGVLPKLATPADSLIVERGSHNSIHEAAELARARGTSLLSFDRHDLDTLDEALRSARGRPVVALNGVYSMTGAIADLGAIHERAVAHGALLYLDDAHGFGILGERPSAHDPYGTGGGGVVRHTGLGYDNIVYVAGLSKAFSSMAAFVTCRDERDRALFESASTSIFSGPIPVASMATALAGLTVNRNEGDQRRRRLHDLTSRLIAGALERGYRIDNELIFPVVNLQTGGVERTVRAAQILWDHAMLFTPSIFPAAPLDRGGLRVSLTADNTRDEVDQLLLALDALQSELGDPPVSTHDLRHVRAQ